MNSMQSKQIPDCPIPEDLTEALANVDLKAGPSSSDSVEHFKKRWLHQSTTSDKEDECIQTIRRRTDIPLSPDVKKYTDLWAVPPTPEEITWIRSSDHKARVAPWLDFAVMAIRTQEYMTKNDFCPSMIGSLHPNVILRNDDEENIVLRPGSANFFKKVIMACTKMEKSIHDGTFGLELVEWLDMDPFVCAALLFDDFQLMTRTKPIGHEDDDNYWIVNRPAFQNTLNRLRMCIGAGSRDYGMGNTLTGQGETSLFQSFKDGARWTLEKIRAIWDGMLEMVKGMASTVAAYGKDVIAWLDLNVMGRIRQMVEGLGEKAMSNALKFLAAVLCGCMLSILGVVSWKKAKQFLYTTSEAEEDETMAGEATETPDLGEDGEEDTGETVTFLSRWMNHLFDLQDRTIDKIAARAKNLSSLIGLTGLGVSAAATCLFYACYMWSDGVNILTGDLAAHEREWVEEAAMVTTLSRNQNVIFSPVYGETVMRLLTTGKALCLSKVESENKLAISRYYGEIMSLAKNIEQARAQQTARVTPFCVGIYGPPGTGKTHMASDLTRRVCPGASMYTRPQGPFWNAFTGQESVLFDEFLAHAESMHDEEFLTLVSGACFMPEMASLDNPIVGQKGTTAAPKLVITTSNRQFPKSKVDPKALQRRRDVNIEVTLTKRAQQEWCEEGTLMMSKIPEDIRNNRGYMEIRFAKRIYEPGQSNCNKKYTYPVAMEMIRKKFVKHMETGEAMLAAEGLSTSTAPAQDIMNEVLQKIQTGVVPKKPTLIDFLTMTGQGKKKGNAAGDEWQKQGGKRDKPPPHPLEPEIITKTGWDALSTSSDESIAKYKECSDVDSDDVIRRYLALSGSTRDAVTKGLNEGSLDRRALHDAVAAAECDGERQPWEIADNLSDFNAACAALGVERKWVVEHNGERIFPVGSDTLLRYDSRIDTTTGQIEQEDYSLEDIHGLGINPTPDGVDGIMDRFRNTWKPWGLCAIVPMVCWGLWSLAKWVLGKNVHPSGEALELTAESPKKRDRTRYKRMKDVHWRGGNAQAKLVGANVGHLTISGATVNCTFITGRTFCAPAHFFRKGEDGVIENGTEMLITTDANTLTIPFDRNCGRWTFENDIMFYRIMDAKWKPLRDQAYKLISDAELEEVGSCDGAFYAGPNPRFVRINRAIKGDYQFENQRYDVKNGFVYQLATKPGDCGAFISIIGGKYGGKIIGMHTAGSTNKTKPNGFSVPLTRELFYEAFTEPEPPTEFFGAGEGVRTESELAKHYALVESHKKAVLLLGMQIPGRPVPWIKLRRHDDSKMTRAEIGGYTDRWVKNEKSDAWRTALEHHYANNSHHPQWWGGMDMAEEDLKESVIDGFACAWERDHHMKEMPLSELAANLDPKDNSFKEWTLQHYNDNDKKRARAYMAELQAMTHITLNPNADICEWKVDYKNNFETFSALVDGPNTLKVEKAGFNNVAPGKTKLRPTIFNGKMGKGEKVLPILSADDERSRGYDPLIVGARLAAKNVQVPINSKRLEKAKNQSFKWLLKKLPKAMGRELTLDEAVAGVEGLLKPIDLKTSPGFPLIMSRVGPGKRDFVTLDSDEKPHPTEYLREAVASFMEKLEAGEDLDSVFLAHLKDERVSTSKVTDIRTRVVYCGDLIANLAFRMKFGAVLVNFNNSPACGPIPISVNACSHDMDEMKKYLDEIPNGEYLAGDFKAFDLRYQASIRDASYEIVGMLLEKWIPGFAGHQKKAWAAFTKHQTYGAKVQFGKWLISYIAVHFSGLFLTTIINGVTNDLYQRMAFDSICSDMEFDDHVRGQYLGDDNRLKFSKACIAAGVNPKKWAQAMALVGQEYTSDVKGEELTTKFKPWEECSFMGAFPRMVNGKWSGALRLDSIYGAVQWKRDYESEAETLEGMLDLASQWDMETYASFRHQILGINAGVPEEARIPVKETTYAARAVIQSVRTGENQFYHTGAPWWGKLQPEAPERPIVEIESTTTPVVIPAANVNKALAARSIHAGQMGIEAALSQKVLRKAVTWDGNGLSEVVAIQAPYGLLALGEQGSMQNKLFDMFIWVRTNIVFDIQLNAQPFSQGALVAYWRPLSTYAMGQYGQPTSPGSALTCHHVIMQPGTTTYQLEVPYMHPRSVLNNFAGQEGDGSLGTFRIEVLNPLEGAAAASVPLKATVTVFSSFKDTHLTMPKPLTNVPLRTVPAKWFAPITETSFTDGQGQGGGHSTTNNNVWVNTLGDVPVEIDNSGQTSSGPNVDGTLEADVAIPMDLVPIVGGGLPLYGQYSGMAKSNGSRPTVGMSLHPQSMCRTLKDTFTLGSQSLGDMMLREDRSRVLTWNASDVIGVKLGEWPVKLGTPPDATTGGTGTIHQHIAGCFQFWRADYQMKLLAAKTHFHTGKLRVVVGYGVPAGITWDEASNYESYILDFDAATCLRIVKAPYNAETAWLNTYSGDLVADPVQDFVMATIAVFVANELVAPDSVADHVEVNIIETYPNSVFAVPRPFNFVTTQGGLQASNPAALVDPGPLTAEAPAGGGGLIVSGETSVAEPDSVKTATEEQAPMATNAPCKIKTFEHFEYSPQTVSELGRRMVKMTKGRDWLEGTLSTPTAGITPPTVWPGPTKDYSTVTIQVRPVHPLVGYFCGWKGSIHIRIFNSGFSELSDLGNRGVSRCGFIPLKENSQTSTDTFKPIDITPYLTGRTGTHEIQTTPEDKLTWNTVRLCEESAYLAAEALYPTTMGDGYIDLLVPFQTIFNFLPIVEMYDGVWGIQSIAVPVGQVQVIVPKGSTTEVYSSMADDCVVGGFKGRMTTGVDTQVTNGADIYPFGMNLG